MRKVIASILLIVSIVFLYKGFVEFRYMISNKAKNQSLREVATSEVVNDPLDRIIDFEKLNSINKDITRIILGPLVLAIKHITPKIHTITIAVLKFSITIRIIGKAQNIPTFTEPKILFIISG